MPPAHGRTGSRELDQTRATGRPPDSRDAARTTNRNGNAHLFRKLTTTFHYPDKDSENHRRDRHCPSKRKPSKPPTPFTRAAPATHGKNTRSSVSSSVMHRPRNNNLCRGSRAAAVLAVAVGLMCAAGVAEAGTGTFIYAGCSPSKYQPGTAFEGNLESLLTSIANAAPNAGYNTFTAGANGTGAPPGAAAYGLYQCRGDLDGGDCAACVRDAVGQIGQVCAAAYAASLQLEGCYVRYDSSNFVGTPDAAMVYRKCSTSTSSDGGFLGSRDAVLGDLQQGVGADGYKVSRSGSVQGVAQCLGDLAAADCVTCLAQAAGQLKGTCGTALAADVYLAQCYVRYWANGYYFRPTQDSQDDVGRTLAIVVGILAGIALFVVFISFLRKTCN